MLTAHLHQRRRFMWGLQRREGIPQQAYAWATQRQWEPELGSIPPLVCTECRPWEHETGPAACRGWKHTQQLRQSQIIFQTGLCHQQCVMSHHVRLLTRVLPVPQTSHGTETVYEGLSQWHQSIWGPRVGCPTPDKTHGGDREIHLLHINSIDGNVLSNQTIQKVDIL